MPGRDLAVTTKAAPLNLYLLSTGFLVQHRLLTPSPPPQVGVDFGTYASGFAYSADGGQHVRLFTTYPDQPAPYPKALTAILYRHGVPLHWGWTAQRVWMGLSPQDR